MARRKQSKISKFNNSSTGSKIFIFIAFVIGVYVFASIVSYVTSTKTKFYEVTMGSNAESSSTSFRGLAIRKEKKTFANSNGYVEYFIREASRISKNTTLYGLDSSNKFSDTLNKIKNEKQELSKENIASLVDLLSEYSEDYSNESFSDVYDYKSSLNSTVIDLINTNSIKKIAQQTNSEISLNKAENTGIVLYRSDGMEKLKPNKVASRMFDEKRYHQSINTSGKKLNKGDMIYKTITDDEWSIAIKLGPKEIKKYKKRTGVKIKFTKDNVETTANIDIKKGKDNRKYGILTLSKYVVRYAKSRFVDIQIIDAVETGLKIPKTALVKKQLYIIPKEYALFGGNADDISFTVKHHDTGKTEVIYPAIANKDVYNYYISTTQIDKGDTLIAPNSNNEYMVSKTKTFNGVYNINSGYTIFVMVRILSETDEYYIVESKNNYGLAIYDHIVLEGKSINENQIISQ